MRMSRMLPSEETRIVQPLGAVLRNDLGWPPRPAYQL